MLLAGDTPVTPHSGDIPDTGANSTTADTNGHQCHYDCLALQSWCNGCGKLEVSAVDLQGHLEQDTVLPFVVVIRVQKVLLIPEVFVLQRCVQICALQQGNDLL